MSLWLLNLADIFCSNVAAVTMRSTHGEVSLRLNQ